MDMLFGFIGGCLIGISASILLVMNGRIAGISGMASGLLEPKADLDTLARCVFLFGLILGAFVFIHFAKPEHILIPSNPGLLISSGLLVGIGTRLGSGCTSGHGICGISRLSKRSICATMIFMSVAMLTVFLTKTIGF